MAEPLNRWLRKDVKQTWIDPPDKQLRVFQELKKALSEPPVLTLPVAHRPFILDTDSSAYQTCLTIL